MGYNFHKIVKSLNESISNPAPVVQPEPTSGVDLPTKVYQCSECGEFYLANPDLKESCTCKECGGSGTAVGDVKKITESNEPENTETIDDLKITNEGTEDPEVQSEAEVVVNEALRALDRSDFKKFNESYRPRARMTTKGELEILVESNGKYGTARRRMTTRQKAAYKLAESASHKVESTKISKKNEALRTHRHELVMMNESRRIRIQACKILERQGAKYNFNKFNESMNKFFESRNYRKMMEDIDQSDLETSELDTMTPDEISSAVSTVIEDTGLDVISSNTDIDGDTATVDLRIEDSSDVEVRTSELENVLSDVFDTDVQIVGPVLTEGDDDVVDLTVIINPTDEGATSDDDSMNEDIDSDEEDPDELDESDEGTEECDCGQPDCPICNPPKKTNESMKKRSRRRRVNEKFTKGTGSTPLFALLAVDSADNDPQFLAQDDSLISGNEDKAEEIARVFVSEDAAKAYLTSAGIEDRFTPVSITVVTNESTDTEMNDPEMIINEGTDDEDDTRIKTDDGEYFFEDGCYYCDRDGKITECDKSEYDAAKASTYDLDAAIKESFKGRRKMRRR